jgi:hypothetical protein
VYKGKKKGSNLKAKKLGVVPNLNRKYRDSSRYEPFHAENFTLRKSEGISSFFRDFIVLI